MGGRATSADAVESWLDDVVASLARSPLSASPLLVFDARTGQVHGSTPAAVALLGVATEHLDDLVEHGVLARPDRDLLRDRVVAATRMAPVGEVAESWSTRLRIHPVGTGALLVDVHVAHHRRPRHRAEVVWATVEPVGEEREPTAVGTGMRSAADRRFVVVHDREAKVVAIGPSASAVWDDPTSLVGVVGTALLHPEDLARILPVAHALYSGAVDRAAYTIRVAASDGRWVTLHCDLQRVAGADDHLIVIDSRIVDDDRGIIGPGVLSHREEAIVAALFDGLRPKQVAERDGVSIHTVRTQLASAYRKLGVAGQGELLARYHRPMS